MANLLVYFRRLYKDLKFDAKYYGWIGAIYKVLKYHQPIKWWDRFYWAIRHRYFNKFHIVKMPTLEPGYYDIDTRMLHANFALLVDYVEKEEPFDRIDWNSDPEHQRVAKEIKELYAWWTKIYPKLHEYDPMFISNVERPGRSEATAVAWDDDGDPTLFASPRGNREADAGWTDVCMASMKYELLCKKIEEENLIRLIKIREYLWT